MLSDNAWAGRPCFIVGGGPSLRGFDFSELAPHLVIAVNRAYELADAKPDLVVSMDFGFWKEHGQAVEASGVHAIHVQVGGQKLPKYGPTQVVPCCVPAHEINPHLHPAWGMSLTAGVGCGGNSGYAALNIADCLGASPVFLLGFDCRGKDGKQAWWHDGYAQPQQHERVYDRMAWCLEQAAPHIRAEVTNLKTWANYGPTLANPHRKHHPLTQVFRTMTVDWVVGKLLP